MFNKQLLYNYYNDSMNELINRINTPNLIESNFNQFIDDLRVNLMKEMTNKEYKVKTIKGIESFEIFNLNIPTSWNKFIAEYILTHKFYYKDMTLEEMLSSVDIGLIKIGNCVYCNIDKDILQWILDNGSDKVLLSLACGYMNELKVYDPYKYVSKYLKLYKGYAVKRKMVGSDKELCHILLEQASELYINGIKYDFNDYISCVYQSLINIPNISKFIQLLNFGYTLKEIENISHKFEYSDLDMTSELMIKIEPLLNKYGINITAYDIINNGLISLCEKLNIYKGKLNVRLLNNIDLLTAIELGIEERDKYGLGCCYRIDKYHEDDSLSTKFLVNHLIREQMNSGR